MHFNVKQSLTYFLKDRTCASKVVILFLLSLLSIIPLVGPLLFFVLAFGYLFFVTNSRILKAQNNLPKFDFSVAFMTGIKFTGFSIICGIVFSIINSISAIIPFLGIILVLLFFILELIVLDLAVIVYSVNLKFKSLFNIDSYKKILVSSFNSYIKLSVIKCLIAIPLIVVGMVVLIFSITMFADLFAGLLGLNLSMDLGVEIRPIDIIVGALVLDIIFLYTSIVFADLNAQFIRQMNGIEIQETEENVL